MAALDPARRKLWKEALEASEAPWVVCGFTRGPDGPCASVDGMAGLIDWSVHGQVSRLLKRNVLGARDTAMLPGDPGRQRPSILLFPVESGAPTLARKLLQLTVKDLAIAESTFPEDFLAKLKQTLSKEGIRCTKLEP